MTLATMSSSVTESAVAQCVNPCIRQSASHSSFIDKAQRGSEGLSPRAASFWELHLPCDVQEWETMAML